MEEHDTPLSTPTPPVLVPSSARVSGWHLRLEARTTSTLALVLEAPAPEQEVRLSVVRSRAPRHPGPVWRRTLRALGRLAGDLWTGTSPDPHRVLWQQGHHPPETLPIEEALDRLCAALEPVRRGNQSAGLSLVADAACTTAFNPVVLALARALCRGDRPWPPFERGLVASKLEASSCGGRRPLWPALLAVLRPGVLRLVRPYLLATRRPLLTQLGAVLRAHRLGTALVVGDGWAWGTDELPLARMEPGLLGQPLVLGVHLATAARQGWPWLPAGAVLHTLVLHVSGTDLLHLQQSKAPEHEARRRALEGLLRRAQHPLVVAITDMPPRPQHTPVGLVPLGQPAPAAATATKTRPSLDRVAEAAFALGANLLYFGPQVSEEETAVVLARLAAAERPCAAEQTLLVPTTWHGSYLGVRSVHLLWKERRHRFTVESLWWDAQDE